MAQNALTVTTPNPTPPTNFVNTGATPPNPATFDPQIYVNTGTGLDGLGDPHYPRPNLAPYYDDGAAGSLIVFAANKAALAVGGTSVPHEGAGTELVVTAAVPNPSPNGQLQMVSCGPALPALVAGGPPPSPNALHASSLNGGAAPTITGLSAGGVSGPGTAALTVTGTGFTRACQVYVNGAPQSTVFVSATSLTVANAPKKATAGTVPVTVLNSGISSAPSNWTFT